MVRTFTSICADTLQVFCHMSNTSMCAATVPLTDWLINVRHILACAIQRESFLGPLKVELSSVPGTEPNSTFGPKKLSASRAPFNRVRHILACAIYLRAQCICVRYIQGATIFGIG